MSILDFILILILFFFTFAGFFFGLIHTLGSLVGTVAGILVAGRYFEGFAEKIPIGNANLAKVVSFFVIFVVASRLVGFAFFLIDKIFKVLSLLPFLKSINRLLGAVLGLAEGAVVLAVVLVLVMRFPFAGFLFPAIEGSQVAQALVRVGEILLPLLPQIVQEVRGVL